MPRLTDEQKNKLAELILQYTYGDIKWGHSGTVDDNSWRTAENKALNIVNKILDAQIAKGD